jgi:hypothetical protein
MDQARFLPCELHIEIRPCLVGKILGKVLLIFQLSLSHHIKYTKRHMFGAVNVGKKSLITQF